MNPSETTYDRPACIWCGGSDITEISGAERTDNGERWFHCGFCHRAFCTTIRAAADANARVAPKPARVSIRILKVPPSAFLEGVDLRPYDFQVARCYEVPRHVAEVLIDWSYAEPHRRLEASREPVRALRSRSDA